MSVASYQLLYPARVTENNLRHFSAYLLRSELASKLRHHLRIASDLATLGSLAPIIDRIRLDRRRHVGMRVRNRGKPIETLPGLRVRIRRLHRRGRLPVAHGEAPIEWMRPYGLAAFWGAALADRGRVRRLRPAATLCFHIRHDFSPAERGWQISPRPIIVLFTFAIRAHVFRRHQPGVMAKPRQLATEMMRPAARLHADEARRQVGKPRFHLAARPLLPQHQGSTPILANDVKRILADIDADHGDLAVECLGHRMLLCLRCPFASLARWVGWSTAGPSHSETLAAHCGRPSDEGFSPYQCSHLSS
jgi:hypothetical protein